jgi:hypothetical protein
VSSPPGRHAQRVNRAGRTQQTHKGYRLSERFNTAAANGGCLSYRVGVQDTLMNAYNPFHYFADHINVRSSSNKNCLK